MDKKLPVRERITINDLLDVLNSLPDSVKNKTLIGIGTYTKHHDNGKLEWGYQFTYGTPTEEKYIDINMYTN